MQEHSVVIVGGGPTGLMLAAELALARVDVAVVERRDGQDLSGLRAGGLHMRTLEVLDQRGVVDRFLSQGQPHRAAPFAGGILDIGDSATRHPYFLGLWQSHIERILAEWVGELGVPVYRGREVAGFTAGGAGVDIQLAGGETRRAEYLVGCDGGRSLVRKTAGVEFPGWDPSTSYLIAEIETTAEPTPGFRRGERGMSAIGRLEDGHVRVVLMEPKVVRTGDATLEDIREALVAAYGTDFGLRGARFVSRFTDMARQAATYRKGRVLLAGDAAHVHSPIGGQGLNLGMQDAVNLGWKLGQVVNGISRETLLDSYHAERHPVGARVLRNTLALTALEQVGERPEALRHLMSELMKTGETRRHYFAMISGLDIHYDFNDAGVAAGDKAAHPLLGRRMPDLELEIGGVARRGFTLLHQARPVLLNFGEPGAVHPGSRADRVQLFDARCPGTWDLPVIGPVPAPAAVLIRPDGHVAWVGEGDDRGLTDSMARWF
jgi:2-polyprenyl-6-methoxyphenol hydroxylase-like FAD-dependent oxidoreductase